MSSHAKYGEHQNSPHLENDVLSHVTFFEHFPNGWPNLKGCLFLNYYNYMLQVLHLMPYNKRKRAYLLSQMINRSFQHTAFFLSSVDWSSSIRCPLSWGSSRFTKINTKPPSNYHFVPKSLERPHSEVLMVVGGTR